MSFYNDIYNDYPIRCGELWQKMRAQAKSEKRDVTFMLMAAAGGLATPYEHLKSPTPEEDLKLLPAFKDLDFDHYKSALKAVSKEIDLDAAQSMFFKNANLSNWHSHRVEKTDQIRDSLEFPQPKGTNRPIRKARDVIKILRNALAHNNIYAFNRTGATEIDELAFFSEAREYDAQGNSQVIGYDVLAMPHVDFGLFLDAWFALLRKVKADRGAGCLRHVIPEALAQDNAA